MTTRIVSTLPNFVGAITPTAKMLTPCQHRDQGCHVCGQSASQHPSGPCKYLPVSYPVTYQIYEFPKELGSEKHTWFWQVRTVRRQNSPIFERSKHDATTDSCRTYRCTSTTTSDDWQALSHSGFPRPPQVFLSPKVIGGTGIVG